MAEKQKSLKFNAFMNILLTASTFIFPFITFPYVTRVLQPEGTGKIAFANSVINYFVMIASLGIPTYGIRACAKVRDNKDELSKTVQEIATINFLMVVVSYILLIITIIIVPRLWMIRKLLIVCSSTILLNFIGTEWLYKSLECYTYITFRSIIIKICALILMFLFVRNANDCTIYAAISVFANAGYGICNIFQIKKNIYTSKRYHLELKRHIKPIFIFFAMSIAVTIYSNVDATMLGFMSGDAEVGYYDVAVKIKVILVNVVTALGTVLLPRASYYIENNQTDEFKRISEKAIEFVSVVSIPLIVSFMLLADRCIIFISGNEYIPSIQPMRIILLTLFFIGMSNITGIQMLVPLGKEKVVLYSEIAGAVIDVILNLLFIPILGASGAATGTVVAEATVLTIQMYALGRSAFNILKSTQWLKILIGIAFAVIWILISEQFIHLNIFIELIVLFAGFYIVYVIMLLIFKESIVLSIVQTIKNYIRNL